MEGFIDVYGMPVFRTPEKPVLGIDGEMIHQGAVDYWQAEVDSLKNDADALVAHVPTGTTGVTFAGDVIVPVVEDAEVVDFLTGKARLPIFNRSGLRDPA